MNRKMLNIFAVLAVMMFVMCGSAWAASSKIGMVNTQRVLFNHPNFASVSKRLQAVFRAKEKETKAAIAKVSDKKKAARIFETKNHEMAEEERKLKAPIFKEIDLAIRTVSRAKGLDIVIESGAVRFGGIDITDAVIKELKKK